MADVSKRVKEIVAEQLGAEESTVQDTSEFDDIGLDSLDQVEVVMTIEEEFDIELSDADAEGITTVGQLIEKVQELVG